MSHIVTAIFNTVIAYHKFSWYHAALQAIVGGKKKSYMQIFLSWGCEASEYESVFFLHFIFLKEEVSHFTHCTLFFFFKKLSFVCFFSYFEASTRSKACVTDQHKDEATSGGTSSATLSLLHKDGSGPLPLLSLSGCRSSSRSLLTFSLLSHGIDCTIL